MKIVGYTILTLVVLFLVGFCYVVQDFKKTTWGGWTPEELEFVLSDKEVQWQKTMERKYAIQIQDITLDKSYREDTVIYMTIWVNYTSPLQQKLQDATTSVGAISKSYMKVIASERPQQYIELTFENLWFEGDGKRLKSAIKNTYLYKAAQDTIIREPNN